MSDLNENMEYIEAYFKNQLNITEKRQFEQRCVADESFAGQVAMFITAEEGIRQKLLQQKKQYWQNYDEKDKSIAGKPFAILRMKQWLPYAAACCVVFAVALYFIFRSETPHELANTYIRKKCTLLSQTMNASKDSIEQGKAAYNNKEYSKALQIFEKFYEAHPEEGKVKKYIGFVYLVTKDYDKALQQFDELAAMKDQYQNPGLFLKAITLLERNKPADKAEAKQLLEKIVNENTEGSKEASNFLKRWQ